MIDKTITKHKENETIRVRREKMDGISVFPPLNPGRLNHVRPSTNAELRKDC